MKYQLHHGDCLAILPTLEDCSVDAIVTDPPAGIAFMGKAWDRDKGGKTEWIDWMFEVALQCRRVIKPGGHALVWAIPRTSHWTGSAWEDAGWQVRDKIYHVFGSGFPKSLDVSKAIDKAAGVAFAEEPASGVGFMAPDGANGYNVTKNKLTRIGESTDDAKAWQGWGTALKPAAEEWWLFRKPLEGTVAANVLKHGTGAINVDGCRVATDPSVDDPRLGGNGSWSSEKMAKNVYEGGYKGEQVGSSPLGRFPANFIHDGSDDVVGLFPHTESGKPAGIKAGNNNNVFGQFAGGIPVTGFGDSGSAARFFYCAKASRKDRGDQNNHPTVKPTDLMRYLCRLVTPPGGLILDPFMGSGSTGKAAMIEGFRFIGIEREAEYIEIAKARLDAAVKYRSEFLF